MTSLYAVFWFQVEKVGKVDIFGWSFSVVQVIVAPGGWATGWRLFTSGLKGPLQFQSTGWRVTWIQSQRWSRRRRSTKVKHFFEAQWLGKFSSRSPKPGETPQLVSNHGSHLGFCCGKSSCRYLKAKLFVVLTSKSLKLQRKANIK